MVLLLIYRSRSDNEIKLKDREINDKIRIKFLNRRNGKFIVMYGIERIIFDDFGLRNIKLFILK